MTKIEQEPVIAVGLMTIPAGAVRFTLHGAFITANNVTLRGGSYQTSVADRLIQFDNGSFYESEVTLTPTANASFTIHDVVIGIGFHWERKEDQSFVKYIPFDGDPPVRRVVLAWRRSYTRYEAIAALRNAVYACELPGVKRLS